MNKKQKLQLISNSHNKLVGNTKENRKLANKDFLVYRKEAINSLKKSQSFVLLSSKDGIKGEQFVASGVTNTEQLKSFVVQLIGLTNKIINKLEETKAPCGCPSCKAKFSGVN